MVANHRAVLRVTPVVASVVAGLLVGTVFAEGDIHRAGWAWPSVVVAVPVGLVLAFLASRWPAAVVLGLVGLLVFSLFLPLLELGGPQPLPIAIVVVVLAGIVLVLAHRAQLADVAAGVLIAYGSAALIFELSIPLHAILGLR